MAVAAQGRASSRPKARRAAAKAVPVAARPRPAAAAVVETEDTIVAKIHERPVQALVCALTVGFVLGVIWRF